MFVVYDVNKVFKVFESFQKFSKFFLCTVLQNIFCNFKKLRRLYFRVFRVFRVFKSFQKFFRVFKKFFQNFLMYSIAIKICIWIEKACLSYYFASRQVQTCHLYCVFLFSWNSLILEYKGKLKSMYHAYE